MLPSVAISPKRICSLPIYECPMSQANERDVFSAFCAFGVNLLDISVPFAIC